MVILILASREDPEAAKLVDRWSQRGVRVLRPADACRGGWSYRPGNLKDSFLSVDSEPIPALDIEGVLSRIRACSEWDLAGEISPADRAFAAAEVTALLAGLLSELPCPVLNRPFGTSLAGPPWSGLEWRLAASGYGIESALGHDVYRAARATLVYLRGDVITGPKWLARDVGNHIRQMSLALNVEFASYSFVGPPWRPLLVSVSTIPDLRVDGANEGGVAGDVLRSFRSAR